MKNTSWYWILLAVPAFGLYFAGHLAPIHEQMHAGAVYLTGGEVQTLEHAHITWYGGNSRVIVFMGYYGELWLYAFMVLISRRMDGFWLGAFLGAGFYAYNSTDYLKLGPGAPTLHTFTMIALFVAIVYFLRWHHNKKTAPKGRSAQALAKPTS